MAKNARNFYDKVYEIAKKIPGEKVVTYGQVAALISTPRSARVAGYALHALSIDTKVT